MADSKLLLRPRWVYQGTGRTLEGTAVLVEDGIITALTQDTAGIDANVIDLPDHLLLPGLANAHTHIGAGPIARGVAEDWDLPEGTPFYMPLTRLWQIAYEPEIRDLYRAIVRWDLAASLLTGTTLVVNQASIDIDGFIQEAIDLGVRTYAGPSFPLNIRHRLGVMGADRRGERTDLATEDEQIAEVQAFQELHEQYEGARDGLIRLLLAPASAHTVAYEVLEAIGRMADELGCPVTTHLCQAPSELEEVAKRYGGKTPTQVLDDAGLLGPHTIAAHGTYVPETDYSLLADRGVTVAHCGVRKAREAVFTPFVAFQDAGVRVALGTDAFTCDLLTEMRVSGTLAKVASGKTHRPNAADLLDAATQATADALGRTDLGRIAEGAIADLVAVRLSSLENRPVYDPLRAAAYYSSGNDVDTVLINGRVVVSGGTLVGADADAIADKASDACRLIWDRARAAGIFDFGAKR